MFTRKKKSKFVDNQSRRLYRAAQKTPEEIFVTYKSSYKGLSQKEVNERIKLFGKNNITDTREPSSLYILMQAFRSSINYLIFGIAVVSFCSGNHNSAYLMLVVIACSILLRFIQEKRFNKLVQRLLKTTQICVSVIRNYPFGVAKKYQLPNFNHDIPLNEIVPGDIIRISAGDIIPADIRLLSARNLLVNQSVLTGETIPIDKHSEYDDAVLKNLPDLKNICFFGSSVVSGAGIGIAIHTGRDVYVNSIASHMKSKNKTNFDIGSHIFVLRTLKFMMYIIPMVLFISVVFKGSWSDAFLYAIAITVSLTPKSLPLTISSNLTRASLLMLKKRMIVKHITAIQNLGAMDILCADKTGTLTEDFTICEGAFNTLDREDKQVMTYAYLNSYYQTGLKNHLDFALEKQSENMNIHLEKEKYVFLDELAYDTSRKRSSVLVKSENSPPILICKGALEDILPLCSSVQNEPRQNLNDSEKVGSYITMTQRINELGLQAIAIGYKIFPNDQRNCKLSDEENLTLIGYVTFINPPVKDDVPQLLKDLIHHGVEVKILTGDNHWDAMKVAKQVGVQFEKILLGNQIDGLNDLQLKAAVEKSSIFAKLSPHHKQRIIHAFQENGHTVGFLGDGINDIPALFASDVGISVHNAVATAKESSDIILMEKNLSILIEGIIQGRKAFININKYLKIVSVTKFGMAATMFGSSIFFSFLPLHPTQMLVQNIIFSFSQSGGPFDEISNDAVLKPSKWDYIQIQRFQLFFGPVLTLFDAITFLIMWYYFNARTVYTQNLFQSAWLIESLATQSLILHIFQTTKWSFKKPTFSSVTTFFGILLGIFIPFSPLATRLGFVPLPQSYFLWMFFMIIAYVGVTRYLKNLFFRKFNVNPHL